MGILEKVLSPIFSIAEGWSKRRTAALEGKIALTKAEWELKVAKVKAEIKSTETENARDYDYDMQVLKNRSSTAADEMIIIMWFLVFVLHFIPYTETYMQKGWQAMGYDAVPWWFEFGMVGILISTLGLMRIFRIMFGSKKETGTPS